jgi:hypothetical protein
MRLPRFEKLRNRRQREFESKLLTLATPKPKSRFLAFINAPFTLWFLSAVVLGFGSIYYTAYKQCIADGTKISEDYSLYRTEMINRQISLAIAIKSAKTLADVYKVQQSIPDDAVKLKDKKLAEIREVLEQSSTRIEFVVNRDAPDFVELQKDPNFDKFFPVFEAAPQDEVTEKDFPALKRFAERAVSPLMMQAFGGIHFAEPSCGPSTIMSLLQGAVAPPISRAYSFYKSRQAAN